MHKPQFQSLAEQNHDRNQYLLNRCQELSNQELLSHEPRRIKSLMEIWNHSLIVDIRWLKQLQKVCNSSALNFVSSIRQPKTSEMLYDNWQEFVYSRQSLDNVIRQLTLELSESDYALTLKKRPLYEVMTSIFDYQDYCRGQLVLKLAMLGIEPEPVKLWPELKGII